jgi:hypothetical protein
MIVVPPEFTFYDSLNSMGNYLLADIIGEGAPAGSGYIHATFASQLTDYGIFFSRYTNERPDSYNLAESYYMATKVLSWMNILVGDPKTTITTVGAGAVNDYTGIEVMTLYPNPTSSEVNLRIVSNAEGLFTVRIFDQRGNMHLSKSEQIKSGNNQFKLDVSNLSPGIYLVQVVESASGSLDSRKLLVQ